MQSIQVAFPCHVISPAFRFWQRQHQVSGVLPISCVYTLSMISPSLMGDLAAGSSGGQPGSPDNPRAAAALSSAIVALHAFLRTEKDPQDRAAATQCLAKLESMRGKKLPGASQGNNSGY